MPADNPPADEYNRGTGLVTMHNSFMPFADSDECRPQRMFTYLTRTSISTPKRAYPVTPAAITEGVEVLRFLLEFDLDFDELNREDCVGPYDGLIFEAAWQATQKTLQSLKTQPSLNRLTSTVLAIFEQTSSPLELPLSAAGGAFEQALSGPHLRWETIGICCVRIGLFSARTRATDSFFHQQGYARSARQTTMLRAIDACLQTRTFCGCIEQINDLTLWLLSSACLLATWTCGDDSSRAWSLMGELSSAIIALGFHKGFQGEEARTPYLIELRKRVVATAHELDKGLATFVGRPPHLSRRYCTMDLPLDLPDSIIIGPIEQFEAALAKLDENGWSGNPMVNTAARHRAMALLSVIREEVLELSLGPQRPGLAQSAR